MVRSTVLRVGSASKTKITESSVPAFLSCDDRSVFDGHVGGYVDGDDRAADDDGDEHDDDDLVYVTTIAFAALRTHR